MTEYILEEGQKRLNELREINELITLLEPHLHNNVEIDVWKSNGDLESGEKHHFSLTENSPLWHSIKSYLEEERKIRQNRFDEWGHTTYVQAETKETMKSKNWIEKLFKL